MFQGIANWLYKSADHRLGLTAFKQVREDAITANLAMQQARRSRQRELQTVREQVDMIKVNKINMNSGVRTLPSGKLPFECQKIVKNLKFKIKKLTKIVIFSNKIAIGNFVEKNDNFCQFFEKNVKFLTETFEVCGL